MKVRKTQEGGLNCVSFFFVFFKLKHTDQKQLGTAFEVMFRTKMQRIKSERERERERRKTQSNYTGSFHNPEVVLSPCTFKESSLKM